MKHPFYGCKGVVMDEREYRAQKATGTINYFQAAIRTKSKKVLASIVEDTTDSDTHLAVAANKFTDARTLTRLIVDRDSTEIVLNMCVNHPAVTKRVLEMWMQRDHINNLPAARERYYIIQTLEGLPEEERIKLEVFTSRYADIDFTDYLLKKVHKPRIGTTGTWSTYNGIKYGTQTGNTMRGVDTTVPLTDSPSESSIFENNTKVYKTYSDSSSGYVYYTLDSSNPDEDINWMVSHNDHVKFKSLEEE